MYSGDLNGSVIEYITDKLCLLADCLDLSMLHHELSEKNLTHPRCRRLLGIVC